MATPEEHHHLGPSTLKYVEICPGYRSSNETNIFAEEGTLLHSAAEHANFDGLNEEQKQMVMVCLRYLDPIEEAADKVLKEVKVPIRYSGKKGIFGTVDRGIITGTHVDLADFKFGRSEIDCASINIQGQAYLLGFMDKYPMLQTATVHFIVPRRDEVLTHDYKREDMEDIRLRISLIIEKAESETPDLRPNTEGCRFCKHKLSCPALADKLLPLAKKYAPAVEDFEMQLMDRYDPALIEDPAVLGKMLNIAQVVESWASAAKKEAVRRAEEEGEEIPGYDLRWRTSSPKFESAQDVFDALSDVFNPEDFMKACSISISRLSKLYADTLPRGEKKGARGAIEMMLEEAKLLPPEESRERSAYLKKLPRDKNI